MRYGWRWGAVQAAALTAVVAGATFAQGGPLVANKHLYSETANPVADIAAAQVKARREHKRILLDFGGNWCGDCQLLDSYYHSAGNAALLAKYYVVVHVDIGHIDKNLDVAAKYGVPIDHGVPGLGIIDAQGKVIYGQKAKEFEHTSPDLVGALLEKYRPGK